MQLHDKKLNEIEIEAAESKDKPSAKPLVIDS
jgi:hypothetical protein